MRLVLLWTLAMSPLAAAPAFAQPKLLPGPFTPVGRDLTLPVGQRAFSLRVNEIISPDGSRRKRTAIIAGFSVAPDTEVGIGLFNSMPKPRGRGPDPRLDGMAKKSRKAAVGLTFRF